LALAREREPATLAALDVGGEILKPEGDWVYC
jgi:hypothetical protein